MPGFATSPVAPSRAPLAPLTTAWATFLRAPFRFLLLFPVLPVAFVVAAEAARVMARSGQGLPAEGAGYWGLALAAFALQAGKAAAQVAATRALADGGFGLWPCLREGVARAPAALLVAAAFWTLLAVGYVLLLVPAVLVLAAFGLAQAASATERLGPRAALRRSATATRGARAATFAALAVAALTPLALVVVPFLAILRSHAYGLAAWGWAWAALAVPPCLSVVAILPAVILARARDRVRDREAAPGLSLADGGVSVTPTKG